MLGAPGKIINHPHQSSISENFIVILLSKNMSPGYNEKSLNGQKFYVKQELL